MVSLKFWMSVLVKLGKISSFMFSLSVSSGYLVIKCTFTMVSFYQNPLFLARNFNNTIANNTTDKLQLADSPLFTS